MKKLLIISWSVFFTGIILRVLHLPFASVLSILGTLMLVVYSIIYFIKNVKSKLPAAFLHLSFAAITTYVLFRLQYWYIGPRLLGISLFFIFVLLVVIAYLVLHILNKLKFRLPQLFLVFYFSTFLALSFISSHSIYYFFNLNPVLRGDFRNTDYHSWDKYSWFLYIAGKQEEAVVANQNAINAAMESYKRAPGYRQVRDVELIKQHGKQIQERRWMSYP
jgi:hypothetical protein